MSHLEENQLVTPQRTDSTRKRDREDDSPTTSPSVLPPTSKSVKMSEEALAFVNNLVAALQDPRVTAAFGTILDDALKKQLEKRDAEIDTLKARVASLEGIVEEQEQYSRRNCVRVWMDQKEDQADNTDDIIISVATKMDVDVKMDEICRSQRVGRTSDRRDAKPRAIICRFTSYRVKQRFMRGRKGLKDTKIYVSDDLTRQRANLFYKTRQKKKDRLCSQCWTFDGKIFLRKLMENGRDMSEPILIRDEDHRTVCARDVPCIIGS